MGEYEDILANRAREQVWDRIVQDLLSNDEVRRYRQRIREEAYEAELQRARRSEWVRRGWIKRKLKATFNLGKENEQGSQ